MWRSKWFRGLIALLSLLALGLLVYQIPAVESRLSWRIDVAGTYLRGLIHPGEAVPTPLPASERPTSVASILDVPDPFSTASPTFPSPSSTTSSHGSPTPLLQASPTPTLSSTPAPSPTPIPESVNLPAPRWERQDWNNCGPAALSMYLNYYGWEGDQFSISNLIKPNRRDRNVNIEEMAYYARNYAGWLITQYRVGGTIEMLKEFIAAGIPVLIESSFFFPDGYWPNDDLWAAHYLLVTAYDDAEETFTLQDSFYGANETHSYTTLDAYWQPFNRLFMLVYLPEQEETVISILGENWDEDANHQLALETAQAEVAADPEDGYAWFNIGSNLVWFGRYEEAAEAYDQARSIGWPQRMLRYQFGPFFAYFHSGRIDDLLTLTSYSLERTPNSEEALLWEGWGLYRQGDFYGAVADFQAALEVNPNNIDAQYALDFVLNQ